MHWTERLRWHRDVPDPHRRNFINLYFDIGWYGVLNGSFISFSAVYLTRIGATPQQLSWFTAVPAIIALFLSLPVGYWLRGRRLARTVFWAAVVYRSYYLFWLIIMLLLPESVQISAMLGLLIPMSIPGTLVAIGFNSLFATVVPPVWSSRVIGIRHAILAITSILTSLGCGFLLDTLPFPQGYLLVFLIAVVGGALSTLHLAFVREPDIPRSAVDTLHLQEASRSGYFPLNSRIRPFFGFRYLIQRPHLRLPTFSILRGDFGRAMGVIYILHFALYLTNPLYYPYWVGELKYTDQLISFGTALFYVCQFVTSTRMAALTSRFGTQRGLAIGAFLLAGYPGISALNGHPAAFLIASVVGGIGWGIAGGAILAYLLLLVPADERPRYMAWNSLLVNLAILSGALCAPLLSQLVGLRLGIGLTALARLASGVVVLTFGRIQKLEILSGEEPS